MTDEPPFELREFAQSFQRLLDWLPAAAATDDGFPARLRAHFGESPTAFPATRLNIPEYDRPNVQVALDADLARPERSAELLGFSAPSHTEFSLSQLVARGQAARGLTVGPSDVRSSSSTRDAR